MAGKGSENCPIDLTDDEAYDRKYKKKSSKKKSKKRLRENEENLEEASSNNSSVDSVHEKTPTESKSLIKRLDSIEEKLRCAQNVSESSGCNNFTPQRDMNTINDKCDILNRRLDDIENFFKKISYAINGSGNQFCDTVSGAMSCVQTHPSPRNSSPSIGMADIPQESAETEEENVQNIVVGTSDLNSISNVETVELINTNEIKMHESLSIDETCVEASHEMDTANDNVNGNHIEDHNATIQTIGTETGEIPVSESCTNADNRENQEVPLNQFEIDEDLKALIPLPPLLSLKEEVSYLRDDQGRILMYLYCAAKRINKSSSRVSAVSGMYLTNSLHNEFTFQSERGIMEVKVEAEIRAALYGIEVIKNTFDSVADVCVMIISTCSWPPFVKAMKADKAYPFFYSCSCDFRDCAHSQNRWKTNNFLGKTQIDVLPDLMLAKKGLKVHWCKWDQISDEEKLKFSAYNTLVDELLKEIIDVMNFKGIAVSPIQK